MNCDKQGVQYYGLCSSDGSMNNRPSPSGTWSMLEELPLQTIASTSFWIGCTIPIN